MCGLLLAATNMKLENWRAKILLIAGVISLSLAFYIIILVVLLVKRPKIFIMALSICFLLFTLSAEYFQGNLILDKYFFGRIEMLLDSVNSVNNRSSYCFDSAYSQFVASPQLLFGNGFQASNALNCGVSTYKTVIYDLGLIGSFLILTLYCLMTILNINKFSNLPVMTTFVVVFLLSLAQRPDVFGIWLITIYLGHIHLVSRYSRELKHE